MPGNPTGHRLFYIQACTYDAASRTIICYANTYGSAFYKTLSHDLKSEMPGEKEFSETNLKYMYYFYRLYYQIAKNYLHGVDNLSAGNNLLGVDDLYKDICSIPCFHQQRIIDMSNCELVLGILHICNAAAIQQ